MSAAAETKDVYDCPAKCMPAEDDRGNCSFLMSAYILAGLAMMLNIRLSYSSAPYALIRFGLPENLFSVFVRRMASSLELWCLPGFIIADAIELAVKLIIKFGDGYGNYKLESKELKLYAIIWPSIIAQWLNFLTYVILLVVYLAGDDQGHLTTFYFVIAVSGFVFGINNVFVFAADYNYIPIYIAGENCFPALTSFIHYITTLIFGNRRKYDSDFIIVYIDILVAIIISFVAAIVWTIAYGFFTDSGRFDGNITYTTPKDIKSIIITYATSDDTNNTTQEIKDTEVTIKTGTIKAGNCDNGKDTTTIATAAQAKITVATEDKTATLTITLNDPGKLAALAHLAATVKCNVKVNTQKKALTIKYELTDGNYKCIDIEITNKTKGNTLTIPNITEANALGLQNTDGTPLNANVKVDPPPNYLTIEYKTTTGPVTKKGAVNTKGKNAQTIAQEIKDTFQDTADAKNYYYPVTLHASNIRYYFKLTKQLNAGNAIYEADASIIVEYGHIFAEGFSDTDAKASMISPLLIVLVGMGLVYAIYPGIAPGMIVPFYLVDKIEMVLLIATIFPPVIIALLQRFHPNWSPKTKFLLQNFKFGGWEKYNDDDFTKGWPPKPDPSKPVYAQLWHFFDLLIILMIILAYLFIYSLHYRDSNISRSIVNQPKMSTALTIIFYMCHEISLAVGFPGMVANAAEYTVLAQMIGAFLMVFLALYSEGYIIEYKSHDTSHWPTEVMTKWNALCYWCKRANNR